MNLRFEDTGDDWKSCDHYVTDMEEGLRRLWGPGKKFTVSHHPSMAALVIEVDGWRGTTNYGATPEDIYETYNEVINS